MRKIAVVGAGHVGVVYAAGLAALGNHVRVVDIDPRRIELLAAGRVWFHEPDLEALLKAGINAGHACFTLNYAAALEDAEFVFVCVPTPGTAEGNLDDSALLGALRSIKGTGTLPADAIIVNKSTVPVGSSSLAESVLPQHRVVSNPEFLAEGRAVQDFFHPARIVIGSRDPSAASDLATLYRGLGVPIVITDPTTAEFAKIASNAFLATKVSFANALATVAQAVGATMDHVVEVLSLDPRIGRGHLSPGLGYGGSCLPKDLAALEHLALRHGGHHELFSAVAAVNRAQRNRLVEMLVNKLHPISEKRVAILGATFKANTDDIRESPAIALADEIARLHADVCVYDPVANGRLSLASTLGWHVAQSPLEAAQSADALVVATAWDEFSRLDFQELRGAMQGSLLFDAWGVIDHSLARTCGFDVYTFTAAVGLGRRPAGPGLPQEHR